MDKSTIIGCQLLFTIVLSLSSPVIYAEVSDEVIDSTDMTSNRAMPAQDGLLEQPSTLAPSAWELHAEQWELARSGETLLSVPVLKQVVSRWLSDKQKVIEIQYPGGEDGEFWVHELTDWLVSLGIPSNNMVTTPGSGADDVIKFNIIKNMK
jgi:hypothetical protein